MRDAGTLKEQRGNASPLRLKCSSRGTCRWPMHARGFKHHREWYVSVGARALEDGAATAPWRGSRCLRTTITCRPCPRTTKTTSPLRTSASSSQQHSSKELPPILPPIPAQNRGQLLAVVPEARGGACPHPRHQEVCTHRATAPSCVHLRIHPPLNHLALVNFGSCLLGKGVEALLADVVESGE